MLDLQNDLVGQERLMNRRSPLSDDECLVQLATAIENHDAEKLGDVAWLIGRLAVSIE